MADSILESLLGEVKSNFNGGIDVAELLSRATVPPRIEVSPPRLIIGGNDEEASPRKKDKKKSKKDKKDRSKDDEKRRKHRSKSRDRDRKEKDKPSKSKDTGESRPWTIEPIKKMYNPVLDDLPLGADFQSVQPPSDLGKSFRHAPTDDHRDPRRDVTKDGLPESESRRDKKKDRDGDKKKDKDKDKDRSHRHKDKKDKDKKEKKHHKKDKDKKKSKKEEDDAVKELQPRALAIKLLPETQAKVEEKRRELEEGEIVDDNCNGGWMSLNPEKSGRLENADEYLAKRLERKKQKEEKEGKKKSKKDDKDRHRDDKDRHRDDKDRDRHSSVSRRHDRNQPYPKSSGSLSRPLSPRRNGSDQSKILPSTWSKHLNTLLKPSNEEFSRSEERRNREREREQERTASRSSRRDRDHDRHRDDHRHIEREIPRRQPRSRSASPVAGRGRNFFRRTDAEWREHQRERITLRRRQRNMSPVRIFESDYTDRHGHIDKKKLMDIATRNVTKLAMSGAMPKGYQLLSTIKNKSVQELVDLCTQLHNEDERARYDRPSSDSEPEDDRLEAREWEYDNTFTVKGVRDYGSSLPPPDAVGFLEDGMPFQLTTDTRTNESILRMSYPVSSGIEHREKEQEPLEDDIPDMPLVTALAKIKTNIPTPFIDFSESQFIGPMKPVGMPSLPPLPKPLTLTSSIVSTSTTNVASTSNLGPITLNKPIEINIPTTSADGSITVTPVVAPKPIVVRASFLRSGKKAAEEVMQKLMPKPEMVPPPNSDTAMSAISPVLQDLAREPFPEPVPPPMPMVVSIVKSEPVDTKPEAPPSAPKDVTHSDALSAILDRVDQLINTGNIEKLAVVEKKVPSPEVVVKEEPITGDFVKIPERTKEPPPPEKEADGEESIKKKEHKKKSKKDKKAEKTDKDGAEGDEKKKEDRKRKKHESKSKSEPSPKKSKPGEMLAIMPPPPAPPVTKVEFDMRDPTPYVKALTSAQLAIDAPPSLKAEWRDPRNPLVSIINDPNIPMPYRIMAPKREPIVKPEDMVFKMPQAIMAPPRAINDLVQRRAQLTVALASDPNDRYIRRRIEDIDRDMSAWAESKNIPGRFTGRTGARILSADELAPSDPRYNAWARKDLFVNAPEHESVFGRRILEGMGWQQGVGLGRSLQGPQEPLKLDVKCDRKGLYAPCEAGRKREMPADIDGKNPISLVMEYCARARLQPPTFTCIESGPNNSRRFLWKCTIDGVEYEPAMASGNKKAGKTQVCYVVLQALGLVPPTVPNS
uniref:Protein kinase domain-containing protein n=1 Tax=Panagrellus redivivus TaxID=6233 RepID=A0A7E4VES4_PANRE